MIEEPEDFMPPPRPSPFRERYLGTGGVTVLSSFDGDDVLVVGTAEEEVLLPATTAQGEATDEFADMDFMANTYASGVTINPGEINYVKWNDTAFSQACLRVDETDVPVGSTGTRYVHLIVPMVTYISTEATVVGPWIERTENTGSPDFIDYTYANTTEWQGADPDNPPYYLVDSAETLPLEPDVFKCLICIVEQGSPRQVHAGAITLPQGYIASIAEAT